MWVFRINNYLAATATFDIPFSANPDHNLDFCQRHLCKYLEFLVSALSLALRDLSI